MKTILHLCADIGSDSYQYSIDSNYKVILVGKDIGVENYIPNEEIYGIFANPVCKEFSRAARVDLQCNEPSLTMLNHCLRIIDKCDPKWYYIENPATGRMRNYLGKPTFTYQPWWYGSPWLKKTALWGKFNIPKRKYYNVNDVPINLNLYVRKGYPISSLCSCWKNHIYCIDEFKPFIHNVKNVADLRSLCSQKFAIAFKKENP